jgi:hypothetical protein
MNPILNRSSWLALLALAAVAGCANQGRFEQAGEEIDEAVEEVEDVFDRRR